MRRVHRNRRAKRCKTKEGREVAVSLAVKGKTGPSGNFVSRRSQVL